METTSKSPDRNIEILIITADKNNFDKVKKIVQSCNTIGQSFRCLEEDTGWGEGKQRDQVIADNCSKCSGIIIVGSSNLSEEQKQILRSVEVQRRAVIYSPLCEQNWKPDDATQFQRIETEVALKDQILKFAKPTSIGSGIIYSKGLNPRTTPAALSADTYAEVLTEVLAGVPANEPTTIALLSPWGRGKTYFSRLVEQKRGQNCVRFSAWQYRTPYEVWSYLYETLHSGATKGRRLLLFSMLLQTNSIFTLALMLLSITVISTPFIQKFETLLDIVNWLGVGIISGLSIVATLCQLYKVYRKIWLKMQVPRHDVNLGLQRVIGEDLRNLLLAWIGNRLHGPARPSFKRYCCGITVTGLIIHFIVRVSGETLFTLYYSDKASILQYAVALTGTIPSVLIFPFLVAYLRVAEREPILLIVDDLDRLTSDLMLQIIESLLLFLDDPEIASRLQVMFLIEEDSLDVAFRTKYQTLFEQKMKTSESSGRKENLCGERAFFRDQMEKHFLFWLRLGPLTNREICDVVETVYKSQQTAMGVAVVPPTGADALSGTEGGTLESSRSTLQLSAEMGTGDVAKEGESPKFAISAEELEEIRRAFDPTSPMNLCGLRSEWTPRQIRTLIYRYQLAREILNRLAGRFQTGSLLRMIANSEQTMCMSADDRDGDRLAKRVASEVA
jgi:hypothetical protein